MIGEREAQSKSSAHGGQSGKKPARRVEQEHGNGKPQRDGRHSLTQAGKAVRTHCLDLWKSQCENYSKKSSSVVKK
jgi:hypothetical protein